MKKLGLITGCLLLLSGCGAPSSTTSGTSTATKSVSATEAQFPPDFPVPLYPAAKLESVNKLDLPSGAKQENVLMRSNDGAPAIVSFYSSKLQSAGWEIGRQTTTENENYHPGLSAIKGSQILTVMIKTSDSNADGASIELQRAISPAIPEQAHQLWKMGLGDSQSQNSN